MTFNFTKAAFQHDAFTSNLGDFIQNWSLGKKQRSTFLVHTTENRSG